MKLIDLPVDWTKAPTGTTHMCVNSFAPGSTYWEKHVMGKVWFWSDNADEWLFHCNIKQLDTDFSEARVERKENK